MKFIQVCQMVEMKPEVVAKQWPKVPAKKILLKLLKQAWKAGRDDQYNEIRELLTAGR